MKFTIGRETPEMRTAAPRDAVVAFNVAPGETDYAKLLEAVPKAATVKTLAVGDCNPGAEYFVHYAGATTPLGLFVHLAVKLTWNNISTGTMVRFGRVSGNWMSYVSVSNKKLMDRGVRLLCELGNIDYHEACCRIYQAIAELDAQDWTHREKPSPVQYALAKLHC